MRRPRTGDGARRPPLAGASTGDPPPPLERQTDERARSKEASVACDVLDAAIEGVIEKVLSHADARQGRRVGLVPRVGGPPRNLDGAPPFLTEDKLESRVE